MRIVPFGSTGKIGRNVRFLKKKRFNDSQATKRASWTEISLKYLYNNTNFIRLFDIQDKIVTFYQLFRCTMIWQ